MDESSVRTDAEDHAQATVAGDFRRAGSYLAKEAMGQAGEIMKQMPEGLKASEVTSVDPSANGFSVQIRYDGSEGDLLVESLWEERDGAARIVNLRAL